MPGRRLRNQMRVRWYPKASGGMDHIRHVAPTHSAGPVEISTQACTAGKE